MSFSDTPFGSTCADILKDGIVIDLVKAQEAMNLYKVISTNFDAIEKANLTHLMGVIQRQCTNEMVLGITKAFEKKNDRNKSRSIQYLIAMIEKECTLVSKGLGNSPQEVLKEIAKWKENLRSTKSNPMNITLRSMRRLRNKRIAHNDLIKRNDVSGPTWEQADQLINVGKRFVGDAGKFLFNTHYFDAREEFWHDPYAGKAAESLEWLLTLADDTRAMAG